MDDAGVEQSSAEQGSVVPDVPSPLGWCSTCLTGSSVPAPAVTLLSGTGLCADHHRQVVAGEAEQGDQMAALAAQAEQQLRGLLGGGPGLPPSSGGRAGF